MELETVKKILSISIDEDELKKYLDALKTILQHFVDDEDDLKETLGTLTEFGLKLDEILRNARDY